MEEHGKSDPRNTERLSSVHPLCSNRKVLPPHTSQTYSNYIHYNEDQFGTFLNTEFDENETQRDFVATQKKGFIPNGDTVNDNAGTGGSRLSRTAVKPDSRFARIFVAKFLCIIKLIIITV